MQVRVILVSNTIPEDKMGGLPRYVRELAAALVRAGCDTTVVAKRVTPEPPDRERAPDGVQIVRYSVASKANPLYVLAFPFYTAYGVLRAVRAARRADSVIHAHFPATALPLAVSRIPYLYTFHAPVWRELLDERQGTYALPAAVQKPTVAAFRASEQLVVRRAAMTFVLSEFMRGQLGELSAAAGADARLLPGGIDIERFSPDPSLPRAGAEEPLLFTARRLTPRTGVDRLVAAIPDIIRAHPRATLAIAGVGEMEAELRRLVAERGVAEHVRFLGRISDEALVDWYRRATLVVMPTVKLEGFGLTTAEAMACGTPVVGTPVGATPELLEPLDPSLITPDNTAPAIAETVSRVLSDPQRLAAIAARCRDHVAPRMGWDAIASRYLEAYAQMGASPGRQVPSASCA
jgi:glycosyltransferase involved in cell wall biosynthesis